MLGVKIIDLDLGIGDVLTGPCARRWDGVTGNRILPEVDLGGGRACETLMRSNEGVVKESECESSFELVENERLESLERKALFQGSPQSFDECNGAGAPDGAEAMPDAEVVDAVAKFFCDETLKYRPEFPKRFGSIQTRSRRW